MANPFKPDDPRINRKGRPKKGNALTDILREMADTYLDDKVAMKDALSKKLWDMAIDGDITAIKYIFDRIDGAPIATTKIIEEEIPAIIIRPRSDD
jgi:hypothetical protein